MLVRLCDWCERKIPRDAGVKVGLGLRHLGIGNENDFCSRDCAANYVIRWAQEGDKRGTAG